MLLILKLLAPVFNGIAGLLNRYQKKTGVLPGGYWLTLIGLTPTTSIELIVLKGSGDERQILLLRRPSNDPVWPNELHFPGTVLRNSDTLETAFERDAKEIGLQKLPQQPTFSGFDIAPTARCHNTSLYFLLEAADFTPPIGAFYSLKNLPKDLIEHQRGQLERLKLL